MDIRTLSYIINDYVVKHDDCISCPFGWIEDRKVSCQLGARLDANNKVECCCEPMHVEKMLNTISDELGYNKLSDLKKDIKKEIELNKLYDKALDYVCEKAFMNKVKVLIDIQMEDKLRKH